jgi:hypothetical protein
MLPLAALRGTAVVPMYKLELPRTPLGIVPVKLEAGRLVKLAPLQLSVLSVRTPLPDRDIVCVIPLYQANPDATVSAPNHIVLVATPIA